MKKLSILLVLAFGFTTFLAAQNTTITGRVTSTENTPIPFANVYIKSLQKGTTTDASGNYSIENLTQTSIKITASLMGYSTVTKTVTLNAGTNTLNFELTENTDELQTVEIFGRGETGYKNSNSFIGTKTATALKDVPQSISYVTKELALDQSAFRVNDIVKNISGVNQFSLYNDISIRGFRVRGQQNSGNLVNGMRAFTSFWKQQLIPHIERVEVIKGPASALFGNASPGGTINRVTKKPLRENKKSITATVGSFNTFRTAADFTGGLTEDKKILYRLNLAYENSGSFRDLQFDKNIVIAPSFTFLPSDRTKINVDLVYQDSDGRLDRGQAVFGNGDLFSVPISKALNAANDFLKEETINATIALNHRLSDNLSFNSVYMRSSYREDLQEHRTANTFATLADGSKDPEKVEMRVFIRRRNWNNDNFSNFFNWDFNLGPTKHKLLVGYDYFQQILEPGGSQLQAQGYLLTDGTATRRFDPNNASAYQLDDNGNPIPNVPHFDLTDPNANQVRDISKYVYATRNFPQSKSSSHGIYIQDQLEYGAFKLLLGLRYESFIDRLNYELPSEEKVTQDTFLPRLGLVYTLNENVNFYGTYVEGYQPQTASIINDPNAGGPFDPLTSQLYEVGTKTSWFNNKLTASLALFYIKQKNGLYNANIPATPDLLVQLGEETSKGIELDVTGRIMPNWSIIASYSYNDAKITESDDPSEIGRQKPNAPEHTGNLWTKYIINEGMLNGLGFGFGANFVTERFGSIVRTEEPPVFPGYELFDAALYYTMDKFQFQVNFNNVFNKTHWVGGYDYIRAFPGAPRNVMTTISYKF